MPRINVYLPDDLAARGREASLNMSALLQDAVRREIAARSTNAWLETVRALPPSDVTHDRVIAALDAARDEPSTRHA